MPDRSSAGRLVHAAAFAEPGVVHGGDRWWAVASAGPAGDLPTLSSIDLVHWQREPSASPRLGAWAAPGSTRSPELVEVAPDRWLLFHGAVRAEDGSAVIGVAAATEPGGVFEDALGAPLIGGPGTGGAIDPAVSTAGDGTRWLHWAQPTSSGPGGRIWAGRLTGDGLALAGAPVAVLGAEQPWQAGVVGAPRVVATPTGLVMFYAAGSRDSAGCVIAVARAAGPGGPFVADPEPLLVSGPAYDGPGRPAVVTDPEGRSWLLFSAWATGRARSRARTPGAARSLWLTALDIDNADGPTVSDPVPAPRPLPAPSGRWRLPLPDDPTPEQERVVRAFTVQGEIRALPARATLRVVLLDLLAQLFEPGVRYPESEVDRRLTGIWTPDVHPDHARLRRLLVDHGFLDRRDGIYRRSGGSVPR